MHAWSISTPAPVGVVSVAKFRSQVLKRADIDPIYLCEELKACPAGRDDAAGSVRGTAVSPFVERFVRRGTEPFELFRSEFDQNSWNP